MKGVREATKAKQLANTAKRREKHVRDGTNAGGQGKAAAGGGAPSDAADTDVVDIARPSPRNQGN
jgi:hypothetical protein